MAPTEHIIRGGGGGGATPGAHALFLLLLTCSGLFRGYFTAKFIKTLLIVASLKERHEGAKSRIKLSETAVALA